MASTLLPKRFGAVFALCVTALAVTGFAQMPVFKRYYIADLPGLAWTDDFFFTSAAHYLAATLFLLLAGYAAGRYLAAWRDSHALTASGLLRAGAYALLAVTGLAHVLGNSAWASLDATQAILVDMGHLAAAMLLGLAALLAVLTGRRAWLRSRRR